MLRIGLIGAGWVAQHHLAGWRREAARAQVVAIADPSRANAESRAAEFGIASVHADAGSMLAAERLDAVDIVAPRASHPALVRLALAHGIHAICQKPLAPTLDEAIALARDIAAAPASRVMVHENWRFRAAYRRIGEWLRAGRIGSVTHAQMTLLSSGLIADASGAYPALVRQPFFAGLERSLVMETLIHHLDTLRFLLGEMTVLTAQLGHACPAIVGEDRAAIVLQTAAGAQVTVAADQCVPGESATLVDRLLLVGERGTIRFDSDRLVCAGERPARVYVDLDASYGDSYAATIAHFLDRLGDGRPFETGLDDNLETLRLVERIYAIASR